MTTHWITDVDNTGQFSWGSILCCSTVWIDFSIHNVTHALSPAYSSTKTDRHKVTQTHTHNDTQTHTLTHTQ